MYFPEVVLFQNTEELDQRFECDTHPWELMGLAPKNLQFFGSVSLDEESNQDSSLTPFRQKGKNLEVDGQVIASGENLRCLSEEQSQKLELPSNAFTSKGKDEFDFDLEQVQRGEFKPEDLLDRQEHTSDFEAQAGGIHEEEKDQFEIRSDNELTSHKAEMGNELLSNSTERHSGGNSILIFNEEEELTEPWHYRTQREIDLLTLWGFVNEGKIRRIMKNFIKSYGDSFANYLSEDYSLKAHDFRDKLSWKKLNEYLQGESMLQVSRDREKIPQPLPHGVMLKLFIEFVKTLKFEPNLQKIKCSEIVAGYQAASRLLKELVTGASTVAEGGVEALKITFVPAKLQFSVKVNKNAVYSLSENSE